jgi:hypothetical protein
MRVLITGGVMETEVASFASLANRVGLGVTVIYVIYTFPQRLHILKEFTCTPSSRCGA